MALTDWILGGLERPEDLRTSTGSNLGVEMRGMFAASWRGLYMEDWGGGERSVVKVLLREMTGLLGGESAGGLGGRLLLGGVRGG